MSVIYSTGRYSLETIGQEADDDTLLGFYNLESLVASTWSDSVMRVASPTAFSPTLPLPRKDEGFRDPLGISVNIKAQYRNSIIDINFQSEAVDDSDNASLLSFTENSLNFYSLDFNPKKYLAVVHRNTPFQDLLKGTNKLREDMGERKGALKSLVKSNFNAFVGAKNTVDELQLEMSSNNIKKETEFSTQAYEKTLADAIEQADLVFGPIMERTSRSEKIRTTLNIVERYKFFFNLPSSMLEYIKNSKYDLAVRDYKKGRHLMKSAATSGGSEGALQSLFEKVWVAVQISVGKVHESIFNKLDNPWAEMEVQMKHMSYLLQLDSPVDPVVYFLENQHKWVIEFVDRSFSEYVDALAAEVEAEELGTEQALLKRAKVLDLLQNIHQADSLGAAVEKLAIPGRWRATLALTKILGEVIGKTIPELFKFTEQFQTNELYNKRFDLAKTEAAWSQITEEIVALLAIAISKLFHAEAVPLPRRSDKSRRFDVIAALNQKKLPPFPNDVCCYVAGHYAGLMAQELSTAVAEAKTVALSKHARKLLFGVFSTFRTDLVSIFCDSWVQDSRALFLSKDPQRTIMATLFQDHQQRCISILQTLVQTTAAVLPEIRPESDPAILECAIPSLIQSTQAFLDGVHYMVIASHEPTDVRNSDLVSGLSCLQGIKERTRKLLSDFETKLGLTKRLTLTEIKTSEKVLDGVFFDAFVASKFVLIQRTIRHGILYAGFDWDTEITPKEIRPYIYEILMALVVVHAETIKMADNLVKRVLTTLVELLAQEFLICFRKVDHFTKAGALQATLEVEFIEQTLLPFTNFKISSSFKSVYGSVQQGHHAMGQAPFQNIQDKELRALEKLIAVARHTTRTQFACFTLNG